MMDALSPEHLIIAPILIPMVAGALMLLYDDRQRTAKLVISLLSAVALLIVAAELVARSKGSPLTGGNAIGIYLLGDWPTPMSIVLVLDRLSAMMVALVAMLAIPALIYSAAGWQRQGQHFHSLFQFLLMGLNGAFLTGDLFNLFVFFEVMLAASYGLLLHGSGGLRVRAGLHYIAINLMAAVLFLIGIAIVYGVTGTLNMADLATQIATLSPEDRPLIHLAAVVLGLAFLIKAGIWPLSFWLPTTYMAAAAPVAAMFAINTKLGIYVILRLSMLTFGATAGVSQGFGADVLIFAGMATIIFGMLGVLASQGLSRITAHLVLVSSGTVLAVTGFALAGGGTAMLSGALFYLISSTIATSALFLLAEPISREEGGIASLLALTADAYGTGVIEDGEIETGAGLIIPGTFTILAFSFIACVLLLAGLPPLSGFIGKFAMLSGGLNPAGLGRGEIGWPVWVFFGLILLSGFATLVALVRLGVQTFWAAGGTPPRMLAIEIAPVIALLGLTVWLTVQAHDVMRYTQATARALSIPSIYIEGVLAAPRVADQPEAIE
ncbi:MAG: monovalent cation/H+ antiporter subunit D [Loktanella sp.]|nr:monovalent cation/H+ antiporter subunit D [Loktanella sp.]